MSVLRMKYFYWSVVLAGLFVVVIISVQFRMNGKLSEQVAQLKKEHDLPASQIKTEMELATIFSGIAELSGSGVEVILKDSDVSQKLTDNPNMSIIHNEDILKVINELKAAGAEAIAINGQRLVATTEISCSGPAIRINKKALVPPVVVTAIGNPETMEGALKMRGGVAEFLQIFGIQISVKKLEQLTIPAYSGSIKSDYIIEADADTSLALAGIGQREADEALERGLAKIRRFAGLSSVSGPGVELVIQSGQAGLSTVHAPKDITDEHLLKVVNELYSAYSEAIAINGQRITATSEIRLAGNHINVNGTPLAPPYRIIAIGDVSALKSRLELKNGLVDF